MKKMKRFLVAMLGGLTAIACLAGISACKKDKEEAAKPSYDINLNIPDNLVEKCVHDYSVVYAEEKATCDVEGYKLMGCSKCGDAITVYTGYGHDYGTATCTEYATCWICGEDKDMRLAAHKMVAAACEADAYCSECDYVEEGTALEHVVVDATCTADSYCSVCNENFGGKHNVVSAFGSMVMPGWFEIEEEDILSYDDNGYAYIDSTCDTVGYEGFSFCETCLLNWAATIGGLDFDEYPELSEVEFDEETALDFYLFLFDLLEDEEADASALMNYLFGENGVTYSVGYKTIAPKHNYVDFFAAEAVLESGNYIDPTCTTNGLKNFKACADCAEIDFASLTTEAEIAEAVTVAGNDEDGRPAIYAVDYSAAVVAKLGHTSIDAEGVNHFDAGKPATCTEDGEQWSAYCQRENCGVQMNEYFNTPVLAFGHNAGGKEPTCTEGVKCVNCGIIPNEDGFVAIGHAMVAAEVTYKDPTCTEAGFVNMEKCANGCGHYTFESVEKLNHAWGNEDYVEAASKEEVNCVLGLVKANVRKCATCGTFGLKSNGQVKETSASIYSVAPSKTHTKDTAFIPATCETAAQNVACSVANCPATEAFAQDALGHKFATAATTATCFQDGKCTRGELCDNYAYDCVVPAYNHTLADGTTAYVEVEGKAPSCTAAGYMAHEQCSLCKTILFNGTTEDIIGTEVVEIEGVPTVVDIVVKHSTAAGGTLYLEKIAHVYYTVAEKLPTCKEAGHSEYKQCVTCPKTEGYTTNGYAKKACASDLASCYDYVECNHSYVVIAGTDTIVAKEGKYAWDYELEAYRLATAEEIEAKEYVETVWRGCGELTKTTNKIPCIDHNQDGFCVVCDKPVAHKYVEVEGSDDLVCDCGKVKED